MKSFGTLVVVANLALTFIEEINQVKTAGGIIGLIAGVFGVMAALITLSVGGIGSAFHANDASTVVYLGWGGLGFSFLAIVLGAVAIGVRGKTPGILLILCAILGAVLGGTFVAICMVLALIGGILAAIGGSRKASPTDPIIA